MKWASPPPPVRGGAAGSAAVGAGAAVGGAGGGGGTVVATEAGGAVVPAPVTTTVPCMFGWMLQWYANVPTVLKVNAKVAPVWKAPESKIPAVSLVTVCDTWGC